MNIAVIGWTVTGRQPHKRAQHKAALHCSASSQRCSMHCMERRMYSYLRMLLHRSIINDKLAHSLIRLTRPSACPTQQQISITSAVRCHSTPSDSLLQSVATHAMGGCMSFLAQNASVIQSRRDDKRGWTWLTGGVLTAWIENSLCLLV